MSAKEKTHPFQLSLLARTDLMFLLPSRGGKAIMIVVDDIVDKIDYSQQEIKEYDIKDHEDQVANKKFVTWNKKGIDSVKELRFTMLEIETLIRLLDKAGAEDIENFPRSLSKFYKALVKIAPPKEETKEAPKEENVNSAK